MLNIKTILVPVDFPNPSLSILHQAATLSRHFHSEIVMLHVVTAESHAAGVPESDPELAGWDMLGEITKKAEKKLDRFLAPQLEGLAIRPILLKGNPAQKILETAQLEKADLIMMPSHGEAFNQFLLGSVTAKVLHGSECPIWTAAHLEEPEHPSNENNPLLLYGGVGKNQTYPAATVGQEQKRQQPVPEFTIHNILCAVDFGARSHRAVSWAARMAEEFGARLTLVHVTASVEFWGPGGNYVNLPWKEQLVSGTSKYLRALQKEMGTKADELIASGDVPKALGQAAKQTKADLLVTGCYPYGDNLRIHGYAIICAVPIPVLSV